MMPTSAIVRLPASSRIRSFRRTFIAGGLCFLICDAPAFAISIGHGGSIKQQVVDKSAVVEVVRRGAAVVRRGGAVVGPRGGVAVRRTTVVRRGAVVRPGVRGAWVRPARYWWRPGGAIAAGAAIGFVAAATAVAWAGAPPAPGYCWYYTDASQQQGFWDVCP